MVWTTHNTVYLFHFREADLFSIRGNSMTSSNNAVRSAVKRALCVGAFATAAAYTPVAVAQDADAELEEITVTGTRIATKDYSSASPISTVDAELFSQKQRRQI